MYLLKMLEESIKVSLFADFFKKNLIASYSDVHLEID